MSGDIIKVNGVCILKAKGLCHGDEHKKYEIRKKSLKGEGVTFRIREIFRGYSFMKKYARQENCV